MEEKLKVKALSSLRKFTKLNKRKIHLNSIGIFNQLIIVAQQDVKTLEASLEYELTPLPLSLFSNKDH